MQAVLRDRFGLVLRVETRQIAVYGFAQTRSGHKLKPADANGKGPSLQTNPENGVMTGVGVNLRMLSGTLNRPVVNETGLDGPFDFSLE